MRAAFCGSTAPSAIADPVGKAKPTNAAEPINTIDKTNLINALSPDCHDSPTYFSLSKLAERV